MTSTDHLNLPKNENGRDFVIGDLHGMNLKLEQRMRQVNFDKEKDRVFSVGDLIDRGPNSEACLRFLDEPWFFAVQGNHEELMYRSILEKEREYVDCWYRNGGKWYWEDEALNKGDKYWKALASKLKALPLTITVETNYGFIGVSHATPPHTLNWQDRYQELKEHLLWDRDHIMNWDPYGVVQNVTYTIHGHTPRDTIQQRENSYYIDTGACWSDGHLSFVQIQPEFKLWPYDNFEDD